MKHTIIYFSAITLVIGMNTSALAVDKNTRCKQYASSAVAQQLENISRGCGLSGPQWSSNHDYHYKWCIAGQNSSWESINGERMARRYAMQKTPSCAGYEADEFSCEAYTVTAIAANDDNLYYGCNFTGGKWNSDYQHHYKWCIQGDNYTKFAAKESGPRKAMLKKCKGCWNYAYVANLQNDINLANNCNLKGPEWKSDFDYHNKWCLKGDNLEKLADSNTKKRWANLKPCTSSK